MGVVVIVKESKSYYGVWANIWSVLNDSDVSDDDKYVALVTYLKETSLPELLQYRNDFYVISNIGYNITSFAATDYIQATNFKWFNRTTIGSAFGHASQLELTAEFHADDYYYRQEIDALIADIEALDVTKIPAPGYIDRLFLYLSTILHRARK